MFKVGPYGNNNFYGYSGKAWDEEGVKGLSRIYIFHGEKVNSIQTGYVEGNSIVLSEKHGGIGSRFDTVTLDYPSEFLTSISGHCSYYGIGSITFGTNRRTYGPFGTDKSGEIYAMTFGNDFFGFHGCSNAYVLFSIGAYVKPCLTTSPSITSVCIKSEPTA